MPFWIAYKELSVGNIYTMILIHYQVAVPITISVEELFKPLVIPAWNSHPPPPCNWTSIESSYLPADTTISTGEVSTRSMKMLFSTPGIAEDAEFSPNTYSIRFWMDSKVELPTTTSPEAHGVSDVLILELYRLHSP